MLNLLQFSTAFLYAARKNENIEAFYDTLRAFRLEELQDTLTSDSQKLVFWMNLYNALVLDGKRRLLAEQNGMKIPKVFFKEKAFFFENGRLSLSLNEIEHGILRHDKSAFSADIYWTLAVDSIDPRVHFALNCGAKSCPPIRFYELRTIEADLNLATESFLESDARYNASSNVLRISELIKWYLADFGGEAGLFRFLQNFGVLPASTKPRIEYTPYDWSIS